jgi:hypothetical protein
MSIFVEIEIEGPLEEVWRLTQEPREHQRWDLRFSEIEYLPRPDPARRQRFIYKTRMGGVTIAGRGETVGSRAAATGERVSALQFWSDDPKSLIREGAGYWKYVPDGAVVRFITGYDYQVRYGLAGRLFDRRCFRPWMAWATAWSFDRLRLWVEKGIDPASSLRISLVHWLARLGVGWVWLYQGLVPKLLYADADELAMLHDAGLSSEQAPLALQFLGWGEIAFGLSLLTARRPAGRFAWTIALMIAATIGAAINSPRYLTTAFNPVSLNMLMAAFAGIGWFSSRNLPSARRCRYSSSFKQHC